jgi:hypothetical protein
MLAVATTLVSLNRAQITPLGARNRQRRKVPRATRLVPLVVGIVGLNIVDDIQSDPNYVGNATVAGLSVLFPLSILGGVVLVGPWVCMWIGRGVARLSRRATTLIAARRIASDPYTAFRAISVAAVAMFVATVFGLFMALAETEDGDGNRPVLDQGVVAVRVRDAPERTLGPLLAQATVVARAGSDGNIVVACADLAQVMTVTCPVDRENVNLPWGILEPQLASADVVLPAAMVFILLVAACGLTVSVITGLIERRRPFALLRASGVRLGDLRRVVMLETGVPLVITTIGGVGIALIVVYSNVPRSEWVAPHPLFVVGLVVGLLVAFAVSSVALPLLNNATRYDAVRYE